MKAELERIDRQILEAKDLWLFLDYDGTLVEFSQNPDLLEPQEEVINVIRTLSTHPQVRIAIISGRRLDHIQKLLPVPGIILAGTYGIEMLLASGEELTRVEYNAIRPIIDKIQPRWAALLAGRRGFYLEDKGYALAIHARGAAEPEATEVLLQARQIVKDTDSEHLFQILGGYKFVEIGPILANKGETVSYLIDRFGKSDDLFIYLGDDDKDEDAFTVIEEQNGIPIQIGLKQDGSRAKIFFVSIQAALDWLHQLADKLYNKLDNSPKVI